MGVCNDFVERAWCKHIIPEFVPPPKGLHFRFWLFYYHTFPPTELIEIPNG